MASHGSESSHQSLSNHSSILDVMDGSLSRYSHKFLWIRLTFYVVTLSLTSPWVNLLVQFIAVPSSAGRCPNLGLRPQRNTRHLYGLPYDGLSARKGFLYPQLSTQVCANGSSCSGLTISLMREERYIASILRLQVRSCRFFPHIFDTTTPQTTLCHSLLRYVSGT